MRSTKISWLLPMLAAAAFLVTRRSPRAKPFGALRQAARGSRASTQSRSILVWKILPAIGYDRVSSIDPSPTSPWITRTSNFIFNELFTSVRSLWPPSRMCHASIAQALDWLARLVGQRLGRKRQSHRCRLWPVLRRFARFACNLLSASLKEIHLPESAFRVRLPKGDLQDLAECF